LLILMAASGSRAGKELVDRVVAVVQDEAIFYSDLQETVKQYVLQRGMGRVTDEQRKTLEKQALGDMISNKLIVAQATKLGIDVPFSEVEKNVERAIEDNKKMLGGEEGFKRQLELEGLTLEKLKNLYREQMRERMLIERVLASEIDRSKVTVSEEEIRKRFEEKKSSLPKRPALVHLATILFAFESSVSAKEEAKTKIDKIYDEIKKGKDFSKAARIYSEDPSAERGGDLGFLRLEDVQDERFIAAAETLEVGEMSGPVLTKFGYHLIKLLEKKQDTGEVHLQHILVRVRPGEGDVEKVYERAREVHDKLMAGAPFDSMAAIYSDEKSSASSGGDLGWLKLDELPQFFKDVLENMKEGDVSPVLRESAGFRIVKMLGREEERDYTFEEVRDDLERVLEQEKMSKIYDDYIKGLREKFYVDVRL